MNRTFLPGLLIFLLLIMGFATFKPAIVTLAIPLVIYLLAGVYHSSRQVDLVAERSISAERIKTGDEVSVTLTVSNKGSAIEDLLLEDQIPAGLQVSEGSPRRLLSLPAQASFKWTYTLQGQRGYYGLGKVHAVAMDSLGLMRIERDLPTEGQLYILPPVLRLRRVDIQPRRTRIFSGTIPARQGGSGVEFFDVREYQQGDSPRWINWHATARHTQNVFSNEFEQERAADVGLILDGRHQTNYLGQHCIFEYSVLAAASLADTFLSAGNRVGLLFYGRQISRTTPGYGKIQGERILYDLSRLVPGDSQSFLNELYIPRNLFPSRSQLVLISSLIPDDYDTLVALRMRGYPILVISPDPVSFEANKLAQSKNTRLAGRILRLQRNMLFRRLRGAGIRVVDWDTSQPFEKVAKGELERRMLLPRGELR